MTGPDYEEIGLEESQDPHSRFLSRFRIAALAKVNNAAYSRFHVKVCIVAGIGYELQFSSIAQRLMLDTVYRFFTDAYDIFAVRHSPDFFSKSSKLSCSQINIASIMLGYVYAGLSIYLPSGLVSKLTIDRYTLPKLASSTSGYRSQNRNSLWHAVGPIDLRVVG